MTVIKVTGKMQTVTEVTRKENKEKIMTNLKISRDKVQIAMARKEINPYELCDKANISYPSYRRIMVGGVCRIATIGKIARALCVDVTEIIENEKE